MKKTETIVNNTRSRSVLTTRSVATTQGRGRRQQHEVEAGVNNTRSRPASTRSRDRRQHKIKTGVNTKSRRQHHEVPTSTSRGPNVNILRSRRQHQEVPTSTTRGPDGNNTSYRRQQHEVPTSTTRVKSERQCLRRQIKNADGPNKESESESCLSYTCNSRYGSKQLPNMPTGYE